MDGRLGIRLELAHGRRAAEPLGAGVQLLEDVLVGVPLSHAGLELFQLAAINTLDRPIHRLAPHRHPWDLCRAGPGANSDNPPCGRNEHSKTGTRCKRNLVPCFVINLRTPQRRRGRGGRYTTRTVTTRPRERVDERFCLMMQTADRLRRRAWRGYLDTTRGGDYARVEPEAW